MGDNLTPEDRRKTMRAVKGKGTQLERRLFSMLAGMGVRGWKKNVGAIPGKPDAAFLQRRVAIFVDGCFWHGCPYCKRRLPRANRGYWKRKIQRNVVNARLYNRRLRAQGWTILRIWEHELSGATKMQRIRAKIRKALDE